MSQTLFDQLERFELTEAEVVDAIEDAFVGSPEEQIARIKDKVNAWLRRGDGLVIYENVDLGHPELGHIKVVSFGSPAAQLEVTEAGDIPMTLPDFGSAINWRYFINGWYRGDPIVF